MSWSRRPISAINARALNYSAAFACIAAMFLNIVGATWLLVQPPKSAAELVKQKVEVSCCCTRGVCQVTGNCSCEKETETAPKLTPVQDAPTPDCWIVETCHFPLPLAPSAEINPMNMTWRAVSAGAGSVPAFAEAKHGFPTDTAVLAQHTIAPPEPPPNHRIALSSIRNDSAATLGAGNTKVLPSGTLRS